MDRYLLLVTWREGKFRPVAGGEIELGTEASSLESTDKQPRKLWAEKRRERPAGSGRIGVSDEVREVGREEYRTNGPGNMQLSEVVYTRIEQ